MIGKILINHNRSIAYVILYFNLEFLNIFFVGTNFTYMCMKTTHFDTYIAISFEPPSLRMKWIHPSYPKHALTKTHSNISILREKKTHSHPYTGLSPSYLYYCRIHWNSLIPMKKYTASHTRTRTSSQLWLNVR